MVGPLEGIRVLDLGRAAVGPVTAEYLAWLGADVIKVEPPTGDSTRALLRNPLGMTFTFLGNNLGKRGIVLDPKNPDDHKLAERLVGTADVLLENNRSPKVLERLGLGYDVLSRINPRIIYLQSSAYGNAGPMQGMGSTEWFAQAAAGAAAVAGQEGGLPEFSRGTASLDWTAAFVNTGAILFALYMRERTGRGMRIQTSQFQSAVTAGMTRMAEYFATGVASKPMGSARPNIVPDQALETADGWITVSAPHNRFWARLCQAIDRPDLIEDRRFASNRSRVENRGTLLSILQEVFRAKTSQYWVATLRAADVPVGGFQKEPTLSASLLANPQVQAEGLLSMLENPWWPTASAQPHWRFDKTEARIPRPAPALRQHQDEVGELPTAPEAT